MTIKASFNSPDHAELALAKLRRANIPFTAANGTHRRADPQNAGFGIFAFPQFTTTAYTATVNGAIPPVIPTVVASNAAIPFPTAGRITNVIPPLAQTLTITTPHNHTAAATALLRNAAAHSLITY